MVDVLTPEQRHLVMSNIRSKDTKPEMIVRRLLFAQGYRYRLHARDLPGKPDIVFRGRHKVIFVNGCFWHSHSCFNGQRRPKSNTEFWDNKSSRTVERDIEVGSSLKANGWDVLVVWECQLRDRDALNELLLRFLGPQPMVKVAANPTEASSHDPSIRTARFQTELLRS